MKLPEVSSSGLSTRLKGTVPAGGSLLILSDYFHGQDWIKLLEAATAILVPQVPWWLCHGSRNITSTGSTALTRLLAFTRSAIRAIIGLISPRPAMKEIRARLTPGPPN